MHLTEEQIAIINSTGNIKINAVAGSGKTTTIIEYARARPSTARILYLAFNKSVRLEASKKFADKGLSNVKIETAHSLAYKHVVFAHGYKVRSQDYKTSEIVDILNLEVAGDKHAAYVVANHINKFIAYFCNSNKTRVDQLNYLDIVADTKAKAFVQSFYPYLQQQTRLLLDKMNKGTIEITHDFYLKKFQLSNPQLGYDYILFDEGQDASPAMLDIFLKQPATKVIVGDTHQQIYGWRFAVNSLEQANFKTFHLSTSFRFSQSIANLAIRLLRLKEQLGDYKPIGITGKGTSNAHKTKAVIGRTNLGLLLKAIEYVTERKQLSAIYFEGNISSYTYADEGTSLYDVLNLYNGKHHLVKDNLIKVMKDIQELEDYIEKTEDVQLAMMVEIVKEYGNEIPSIIQSIKDKHVANDEKEKASYIFSTVHRCKGMEYDEVHLVNDFITEKKLEKILAEGKSEETGKPKLNEEINLLYVAVTRAKTNIHIPETLMPVDFPPSLQIHIEKEIPDNDKKQIRTPHKKIILPLKKHNKENSNEKAATSIKETHTAAHKAWTKELDAALTAMYKKGNSLSDMATHFGRTKGAIIMRINKLELVEQYG